MERPRAGSWPSNRLIAITRAASTALLVALVQLTPARAEFHGKVIRVLDGDTVDVLVDQAPRRVRLADVDAPEKGQPFGQKARSTLASLIAGRDVAVREVGVDRYGRVIGVMQLRSSARMSATRCDVPSVNETMVARGMAWAYLRYLHEPNISAAEKRARFAGLGLWADDQAIAPWEWRAASARNTGREARPR